MARNRNNRQQDPPPINNPAMAEQKFTISVDALFNAFPNFEDKAEQDIEDFLNQFDLLAQAANFPEEIKLVLLKAKISGKAAERLRHTPELNNAVDFRNLALQLKNYFKKEKSLAEAQLKFTNAKQKQNQSVAEFTKNFNIDAQKYLAVSGHAEKLGANDFLQTIKLTKYIEALRPDIAFEILKVAPTKFEDAVKIAKNIEIALDSQIAAEINTTENRQDNKLYDALIKLTADQTSQIHKLTEQLNLLQIKQTNQKENNITNHKPDLFCHICSKTNHETSKCFFNKKNNKTSFHAQNSRFSNSNNMRPMHHYSTGMPYRNYCTPIQNIPQNHNWQGYNNIQTPQWEINRQQEAMNFSQPQQQHPNFVNYAYSPNFHNSGIPMQQNYQPRQSRQEITQNDPMITYPKEYFNNKRQNKNQSKGRHLNR